jgi:DNA-binding transcriptional MerR regulator
MKDTQTIAEVAKQTGLSKPTLRYYEKIGLIDPISREVTSRHRRYSKEVAATVETLSNLRTIGLSINDMRKYLEQRKRGDAAAPDQVRLFESHAKKIEEEMAKLETRQSYLVFKIEYWKARASGDFVASDRLAEKISELLKKLK